MQSLRFSLLLVKEFIFCSKRAMEANFCLVCYLLMVEAIELVKFWSVNAKLISKKKVVRKKDLHCLDGQRMILDSPFITNKILNNIKLHKDKY